ncbi:MAG: hypothetical protein LBU79_08640, partial [Planctomycetota bacterium]|nr:hypothetical protein [Planctomycetota bacterium]
MRDSMDMFAEIQARSSQKAVAEYFLAKANKLAGIRTLFQGPRSFGQESRYPRHHNVTDLDSINRRAREAQPAFNQMVKDIARNLGGKVEFRPGDGLKTPGRTSEKINRDYYGDAARAIDILGATILLKDKDSVLQALDNIKRQVAKDSAPYKAAEELGFLIEAASETYYETTGDQSNALASSSVI